jgi:hypothetical protein
MSNSSAPAAPGPPSYDLTTSVGPHAQLHSGDRPSLVLDGPFICSVPTSTSAAPSSLPVPLYEITKTDPSLVNGNNETYEVRKLRYRLTSTDGEGDIKARNRSDPIYYFRTTSMLIWYVELATIFSSNDDGTMGGYKTTITLSNMVLKEWRVPGHFMAKRRHTKWLGENHEIEWTDWQGRLLAVESVVDRGTGSGGSARGSPSLEIKVDMSAKLRDLLVVCWVGRVWKDALKLHGVKSEEGKR